ncbi:hypothetical protein BJ165DRAFT_1616416 [Panaeolus papilionaceus]|nr:hypothetical protein BJ165DRAFT_1616416 [Panaeolus papilionaceus]
MTQMNHTHPTEALLETLCTPTPTICQASIPLPTNSSFHLVVNHCVMEDLKLRILKVEGDISVDRVTRIPLTAVVYIIMGPTGAGKSTFIEALAGPSQNLAISSNQLTGFTQHITPYKLVNVKWGFLSAYEIYLVDTPGFSDSRISEIEVMEMLRDWLEGNSSAVYWIILFLTPITMVRLPGSRRRTIKMLQESLGGKTFSVNIITTMWDTIHSEQAHNRAENTFEQLRDQVFKEFFGPQKTILKRFMGNRTSALQVIDGDAGFGVPFDTSHTPSTHLYCDLHERIEGTLQKKILIELNLAHSDAQTNTELKMILNQDWKENDETLAKFISQLVKFGQPPHEFREGAQALRKTIAAKIVPSDEQMQDIFRQWAEEPDIGGGPGSDSQRLVPETMIAEEVASNDLVHHQSSREVGIKRLLGHVVDLSKIHRPKWIKRWAEVWDQAKRRTTTLQARARYTMCALSRTTQVRSQLPQFKAPLASPHLNSTQPTLPTQSFTPNPLNTTTNPLPLLVSMSSSRSDYLHQLALLENTMMYIRIHHPNRRQLFTDGELNVLSARICEIRQILGTENQSQPTPGAN